MIRAVAFDYGGVLELREGDSPMETAARMLEVTKEELMREYYAHNHLTNVQNRPWDEVFTEVVAKFDGGEARSGEIIEAIHRTREKYTTNTELIEQLPVMRSRGLKVGVLSNSVAGLRDRLRKQGILDLVDHMVISGETGFQKPHREAFLPLFKGLEVEPHETVFVDDSSKSLEKAEEIGYVPLLFKNNRQFLDDLRSLGVSI